MLWVAAVLPGLLAWSALLLLPWKPWRVRERLEPLPGERADLSAVTVLIPARDEAATLPAVLKALQQQGEGLAVRVIDDQSRDGTAQAARASGVPGLQVIEGAPLPAGWSGKLWALEQGRRTVDTPLVLLLDADIVLAPGMLAALLRQHRESGAALTSVMASLRMRTGWERLLLPAFIYFFRLLYPFALANDPARRRLSAAAGGCLLLERRALEELGGFAALRGALIDDCTLAARVKRLGHATWVGLSHSVSSVRAYDRLQDIWDMVARSAFTQLRHSGLALLGLSAVFALLFWAPLVALAFGGAAARLLGLTALVAMALSYLPTLRYYGLSAAWAAAMPLIGSLFLAMTWSSATRFWAGRGAVWRGRAYGQGMAKPEG